MTALELQREIEIGEFRFPPIPEVTLRVVELSMNSRASEELAWDVSEFRTELEAMP